MLGYGCLCSKQGLQPVPYSALERGAKQVIVASVELMISCASTCGTTSLIWPDQPPCVFIGSDLGRRAHEDPEASE
jgi:hypothetical protein